MHKDGHAILYALTFALNPIIQKNANGMIKNWIDWMKVLGMFAIIWGHCFPQLFSDFLYAFNVPLFFFISSYLSKKESQNSIFWSIVVRQQEWLPLFEYIATFFCSVITLLVFIPIIYIISRYIPFVIGNRNIN